MANHYETLNIAYDATAEQVQAAFGREALKWQPERNLGDPGHAAARTKAIFEAFRILSDATLRQVYDQGLDEGAERSRTVPADLARDAQSPTLPAEPPELPADWQYDFVQNGRVVPADPRQLVGVKPARSPSVGLVALLVLTATCGGAFWWNSHRAGPRDSHYPDGAPPPATNAITETMQAADTPASETPPAGSNQEANTGAAGVRETPRAVLTPIEEVLPGYDAKSHTALFELTSLPGDKEFVYHRDWLHRQLAAEYVGSKDLDNNYRAYFVALNIPGSDCHSCTPLVAMFLSHKRPEGEVVVLPLQVVAAIGSFGAYKLADGGPRVVDVAPKTKGVILEDGDMHFGELNVSSTIIAVEKTGFRSLGRLGTRGESSCEEKECPRYDTTLKFGPSTRSGYFVISAFKQEYAWNEATHALERVDDVARYAVDNTGHYQRDSVDMKSSP